MLNTSASWVSCLVMTNEIGFIVNVESPLVYVISIKRNSGINRYDYVYIPMRDYVDDKEVNVNVLGQVLWIRREPIGLVLMVM